MEGSSAAWWPVVWLLVKLPLRRKAEFPGLPSLAFHPLSGDIYAVCSPLGRQGGTTRKICFLLSICPTKSIWFTHQQVFGPPKYSQTKYISRAPGIRKLGAWSATDLSSIATRKPPLNTCNIHI